MASRSLGSLTLDLLLKLGGFEQGMDKAARLTDKRMREIEKSASRAGKILGTAIAAGAGIAAAALIASTKAAIDNADAIRDMSIRVGISTETLSAYGYAAKQTGTDIDELGKGLLRLSKNAAAALDPKSRQANLFEALGVDVKDAEGNLVSLQKIVPQVADAFSQLEDGTTKTALSLELFGRSGANLTEFLNQGGDGLDDFRKKAEELGIVISQDTADAADEFNDLLGDIKVQASGLGLSIAQQLLPSLIEAARDFSDLVKEGDLANNIVSVLSGTLRLGVGALEGYANAVKRASIQIEGYLGIVGGIERSLVNGAFSTEEFNAGIKQIGDSARNEVQALDDLARPRTAKINIVFAGEGEDPSGLFKKSAGELALESQNSELEKRLAKFFSNPSGKTTKAGRAEKSEEEKQAEQLQKAYESLAESQRERIALFGLEGEAVKVLYDIENGALKGLSAELSAQAIQRAEEIDNLVLMEDLHSAAADAVKKETEAYEDHQKQTADLISDLEFELALIGMTNLEREKAIALRYAEVDAMSAEGQKISSLLEEIEKASESQAFIDDLKTGLGDMFVDFVSGAKSAKQAFGDFADAIYARALEFLADKAIQALFDSFGGQKTGASGGGWAGLLSSLAGSFGGGRASGGSVNPGIFYRINENGPEMLSIGNKDYLMMGSQAGQVTPQNRMGGGLNQVNQITIQGRVTRQTEERISQLTGREAQRALLRTGV